MGGALESWAHIVLNGSYEESLSEYQRISQQQPPGDDIQGAIGAIHARLGNVSAAQSIMTDLLEDGRAYSFGRRKRWAGKIAALLGQREQAVRYIRESFVEGQQYGYYRWLHDVDLDGLAGYEPFEELMRPKG